MSQNKICIFIAKIIAGKSSLTKHDLIAIRIFLIACASWSIFILLVVTGYLNYFYLGLTPMLMIGGGINLSNFLNGEHIARMGVGANADSGSRLIASSIISVGAIIMAILILAKVLFQEFIAYY